MKKDADAVIIIFLNIFKVKNIIIVYFGRLRINDFKQVEDYNNNAE